ncbi:hypothetical protein [Calothrix sp. NIES-3974]|uniref:hypothetical protein n=1 Tax=Calothrix sp. NIES-3974 TaxID=2005462 RepID=UPI000B60FDB2|nr:hypothetical protein [Calothrix sp. NIES-3974]BAZ05287.1 hypothetical protein NIES3974_19330 [Calothrix sp. NIES-3974]
MTTQTSLTNVTNYLPMNKHIRLIGVSVGLAISLLLMQINTAQAQKVSISRNFQPNPLTLTGTSGGAVRSNCGNLAATPNHIIEIKEPLRLNFSVAGAGEPTLLIEGPAGRFCSLSDSYSGGKSEISGYWIPGDYTVHVGQSSQSRSNYTLSISQPKK